MGRTGVCCAIYRSGLGMYIPRACFKHAGRCVMQESIDPYSMFNNT